MRPRRLVPPLAAIAALSALAPTAQAAPDRAAAAAGAAVPGSYIVVLKPAAGPVDQAVEARERRGGFRSRLRFRTAVRGFSARLSAPQVARLRDDDQVASVTPNRTVRATATLAANEEVPTGVQRVGAAAPGLSANPASTIGVGVIDTGVDLDHPDLSVAAGTNCVTPGATPDDDNGHGTHVAGSIAAGNTGLGLVGVAPGTRITAVKVLDAAGDGTWDQIICGIDWVTRNAGALRIGVVNMSLGGLGTSADNQACGTNASPLHEAICASTRAGVRYVVAAGNDAWPYPHSSAPDVPASYDEVVTVTAMGDSDGRSGGVGPVPGCRTGEADDRYASFSNWSDTAADNLHTIAAPGVCIRSTWPGGIQDTISGTSMASPHVAGLTALCMAEGRCTSALPQDIVATLDSSDAAYGFAGDPSRPVSGRYYGRLALSGTTPPASAPAFTLSATPSSVAMYRGGTTSSKIAVTPSGGFASPVQLSVSGLPSRVTASFSPNPTTTSSTLSLRAASNAQRGTWTATVRGTSGSLARTTTLTVTVR